MNDSSGHQLKEVPTLLGPWFLFPVAAAYILIAVVAAVGNLLVCFAILTSRSLRSKPSNLLLLSLAVSDLLTAVLAIPFDIDSFLQGHWRHGPVMCVTSLTSYLITVPTSLSAWIATRTFVILCGAFAAHSSWQERKLWLWSALSGCTASYLLVSLWWVGRL